MGQRASRPQDSPTTSKPEELGGRHGGWPEQCPGE